MDREKLFLYNSGILHLNQHCFNRKMKQTNKQTTTTKTAKKKKPKQTKQPIKILNFFIFIRAI